MQTIDISTEEEMISQIKLLMQNGYDVGVHKDIDVFGNVEYLVAYQKPKRSEKNAQ